MFASIRAINGTIVVLLIFLCSILLFTMAISTTTVQVFAVCAGVTLFYISDLAFRKKGERSDARFAVAWTLFHSWTLYLGATHFPGDKDLTLIHSAIVATFCGLPFVANLIYLALLPKKMRTAA